MNLGTQPLVRNFRRARWRAVDFEVSGCAQELKRALERASAYASREALAPLEEAYRDCEAVLLYWTGPYVPGADAGELWRSPLDETLEHLNPLSLLELRVAMRRARAFAREAYPAWRWPRRVIGALTLAWLLGALLRRCEADRRMDDGDAVSATYRKLIANRSTWMPG